MSGGPNLNVQDFVETSVPVTLTNQAHIDTQFITSDLLLSMDNFSKRVLRPKIASLANSIDVYCARQMMIGTSNIAGTPGTALSSLAPVLQAGAILDVEAVPRDGDRFLVLDPFSQASLVPAFAGLLNPQASIGEQYKKGLLSRQFAGFDAYLDQNIASQTFGAWATAGSIVYNSTYGSSAVISTGWADGGTLGLSGLTASTTINVGDTFTIAGVYMANPQSRNGTTQLRTFVVRPATGALVAGTFAATNTDVFGNVLGGTYTANGSGQVTLYVAEAVITGGQFQNVSGSPVSGTSVVTPTARNVTGAQNLAFHKDSFTLVSADLELPGGVDMAARVSHEDIGFSMRVVRQYTINNDALPTRIDILYGVAPLYREFSCRLSS